MTMCELIGLAYFIVASVVLVFTKDVDLFIRLSFLSSAFFLVSSIYSLSPKMKEIENKAEGDTKNDKK